MPEPTKSVTIQVCCCRLPGVQGLWHDGHVDQTGDRCCWRAVELLLDTCHCHSPEFISVSRQCFIHR